MSMDGIMYENIDRYMACLLQACMFMCVVTLLIFPQTAVGTTPRAGIVRTNLRILPHQISSHSRLTIGSSDSCPSPGNTSMGPSKNEPIVVMG